MSEKRVRGNVPNTNCEAFSPMTYIYTLRPCSVWKGLKRFERDWRGLNPLQVKILLKPPQSPSIPVARGLSEHGLKMFYKMSVKGGNVKKKRKIARSFCMCRFKGSVCWTREAASFIIKVKIVVRCALEI